MTIWHGHEMTKSVACCRSNCMLQFRSRPAVLQSKITTTYACTDAYLTNMPCACGWLLAGVLPLQCTNIQRPCSSCTRCCRQ